MADREVKVKLKVTPEVDQMARHMAIDSMVAGAKDYTDEWNKAIKAIKGEWKNSLSEMLQQRMGRVEKNVIAEAMQRQTTGELEAMQPPSAAQMFRNRLEASDFQNKGLQRLLTTPEGKEDAAKMTQQTHRGRVLGMLSKMQGTPLGGLAESAAGNSAVMGGLESLSAMAGPAAAGLAAVGAAAYVGKRAFDMAFGWVQKANPSAIQRFTLAMDDAQAVLGHQFVPMVDGATRAVRYIGDVLASDNGAFKSAARMLGDTFVEVAHAARPFIEATKGAAAVANVMPKGSTSAVIEAVLRSLGLGTLTVAGQILAGTDKGTSMGASAGQASFIGLEDLSKQTSMASFAMGVDPIVDTAKNTAKTNDLLQELIDTFFIKKIADAAWDVGASAAEAIRGHK